MSRAASAGAGKPSFTSICKLACLCAVSDGVPRRSVYVALVVGTVLNVINQGDAFLGMASINWLKLVLTYCVPTWYVPMEPCLIS
jgi:hypothetical protein